MKRTIALSLVVALMIGMPLAGCTSNATEADTEAEAVETQDTEESADTQGEIVGGWEAGDEAAALLEDEDRSVFDAAVEGLLGVTYEPVALLATQLVSGTNYAFLAKGTTATAEPETQWYVLVAYRDLEGNVSLSSINQIDVADQKVTDADATAGMTGAWSVVAHETTDLQPAEAAEAFEKAMGSYVGMNLHPIATLGTQLVAGTNYLILCEGSPVVANPESALYFVRIYADLEGNAEVSEVEMVDLVYYVTKPAA